MTPFQIHLNPYTREVLATAQNFPLGELSHLILAPSFFGGNRESSSKDFSVLRPGTRTWVGGTRQPPPLLPARMVYRHFSTCKELRKVSGFRKLEILPHFYTPKYPMALKVWRNMDNVSEKNANGLVIFI